MTPLVVLGIVLPFMLLFVLIVAEASSLYRLLEQVATGNTFVIVQQIRNHPLIAPWLQPLSNFAESIDLDLNAAIVASGKRVLGWIASSSGEIVRGFFAFIIKLMVLVMTLFFIYRDGEDFLGRLWSLFPLRQGIRDEISATVKRVLRGVIYGIFMTCLVQGVLGGIGFWVAGVPAPILFGAVMAVSALIPLVGTALIWVPAVLYLMMNGHVKAGIGLALWGGAVVSSIDNLIRPLFISSTAHLHLLVVALGALGGLAAWGPFGAVLGPLLLSLVPAVMRLYHLELFPDSSYADD
jgi:predicted PurR-regulated permease PerM